MARMVDADVLKEELIKALHEPLMDIDEAIDVVVTTIDDAPTVDAVEVVRCKDCKYGEPNGQYGCKCYHYELYETHEMSPSDFCSHAERRKDGTD